MMFMPPGSAKSTYGSIVCPSKALGDRSDTKIILGTWGDDLCRQHGRRIRSIIRQPRYKNLFNACLTGESTAATEFSLTNGSTFHAAGMDAGVTGFRANGLIIDDPVKGRTQADSETSGPGLIQTYQDNWVSRLVPKGWIVMIMTRWNEADLAGSILPDGWNGESGDFLCKDKRTWRVLCLAAKCESETDPLGRKIGDYLAPEWFPRNHWVEFENVPRTWNSLYQQRPSSLDGDFFKPENMPIFKGIPHGTKLCRGWDFASIKGGGDWTVGIKLGKMPDGRYLIVDVIRFQGSPDEVEAALVNTASSDGLGAIVSLPQDPGQAGKYQIAHMTRQLAGHKVRTSPESGDKETRADPAASQMNVGNICMLEAPWNDSFKAELRVFPNGRFDDQVDALSRAFNELANVGSVSFGTA